MIVRLVIKCIIYYFDCLWIEGVFYVDKCMSGVDVNGRCIGYC